MTERKTSEEEIVAFPSIYEAPTLTYAGTVEETFLGEPGEGVEGGACGYAACW